MPTLFSIATGAMRFPQLHIAVETRTLPQACQYDGPHGPFACPEECPAQGLVPTCARWLLL